MPMLLRKLLSPYLMDIETGDGDGNGGGPASDTGAPTEAGVDSGSTEGGDAGVSGAAEKPAEKQAEHPAETMLDAVSKALDKSGEKKPDGQEGAEKPPADGKKADEKPDDKAGDPLKMPEGLSASAQQRFQTLANKVRESETKIAEIEQKYQQAHQYASSVSSMLRDAGASPEQLHEALAYVKAINSGDLNTRKSVLLAELRDVSLRLGEPVEAFITGADPLQQFPDLKEAVDRYQITREHALELARSRSTEQATRDAHEAHMAQQQERQRGVDQWVREKDAALAEIGSLTKKLAETDPLFPLIQGQLMANEGGLKEIVEKYPPSTWVSQVNLLISTARNVYRAAKPSGGQGEPRPLSGGGGKPSGSKAAPSSMFEAVFPQS